MLIRGNTIETQLGYWDNVMTEEYMEGLGKAYVDVLEMIVRCEESRVGELGL